MDGKLARYRAAEELAGSAGGSVPTRNEWLGGLMSETKMDALKEKTAVGNDQLQGMKSVPDAGEGGSPRE